MKEQKYHIYLTEQERSEVIKSLIDLKNTLIRQGKYTDAVDDVLVKLTGAKRKKLKNKKGSCPCGQLPFRYVVFVLNSGYFL